MNRYKEAFERIQRDSRYQRNLDWGKPRRGHPEGTVRAHIEELEQNLAALVLDPESEGYWKLKVLLHVHDTFKADANRSAAIIDPDSHASLAAAFLREFLQDEDLMQMVQLHDEPYALWRQSVTRGQPDAARMGRLQQRIEDWRLFLTFLAIDGIARGKDRRPVEWAFATLGAAKGLQDAGLAIVRRLEEHHAGLHASA